VGRNAPVCFGRKDLVAYALLNNSPHEDTLGRSQKVGKEEIVGMVKALELYLNDDHEALAKEWQSRLESIAQQLAKVPGVKTTLFTPDIANHVPHLQITWDSARIPASARDLAQALRKSKPSIVIGAGAGEEQRSGLVMNSFMLQPGEHDVVAEQLQRVFREHTT
jgi:L-seryl-tRNA(Ser) seleniumtransferase